MPASLSRGDSACERGRCRGLVGDQVENEAEDPFRETCGDGDGQDQNGNENEDFHWPGYRHVPGGSPVEARELSAYLGRNLHPGTRLRRFDEDPGADQALNDAGGRL
jgi:hypothetical protein